MSILIIYPIIEIFFLSFTNSKQGVTQFVGINNFINVFQQSLFGKTLKNTGVWCLTSVVFAFLLGLGTALLLNQKFIKLKGLWRALLMISWILPGVVKSVLWKWLYSYDFGILNHLLLSIGFIKEPIAWLFNPKIALWAVILVQVWATFPFVALMITSGLQSIPQELLEAGKVDGANKMQQFFFITLPLLENVSFITILILTIWSLNEFALIWVMTQGGPMGSTQILSLAIYNKFLSFDFHEASAISLLQLGFSMIFASLYVFYSTRKSDE